MYQTNGRDDNGDIIFSQRYQAGDMKEEDEEEDINYNSYLFRFGRALMYYDKQQLIKEANEKWSSEPYFEKKSPTKVKFSDVVNYVEPSDEAESEEEAEEKGHVEEDFETFTNRLFNDIMSDLQKLPDQLETTSKEEVNDELSDGNESKKSKESKSCAAENKIEDKNNQMYIKSLNIEPPIEYIPLLSSSISSNDNSDGYLRTPSSLKTSPKCEQVISILSPLNLSNKDKQKVLLPENNHKITLQREFQKDLNDSPVKQSNVLKKSQRKILTTDTTQLEQIPNDLTSHNEKQNQISNNLSFLNTYVKQEKKKFRKKTDNSSGIKNKLEMKSNNLYSQNDRSHNNSDNSTILNIYYKQIKKKSDTSARCKTKSNHLNSQNEELPKVSNENSFAYTSVKQNRHQTTKETDIYTGDKTHTETKSNNLNSLNEVAYKIATKTSLLNTHVKQNNQKTKQKLETSSNQFPNFVSSKLTDIDENIVLTIQPKMSNQLETKRKSKTFTQNCNVSKSKNKKPKVDSEKIDSDINKQTKKTHKRQTNGCFINSQEINPQKSSKVKTKQIEAEIFPIELKQNSNKPTSNNISLLTKNIEQNQMVESKNVSSISKINICKPKKSCVKVLTKTNPTTANLNSAIKKHIADKQMSNNGEISKQKFKTLSTTGVKSSDLKTQIVPSKGKKKKSISKKNKEVDPQTVNKEE